MSLQAIQIDTQNNPNCAVIWLHGLGANGHDFEPIVSELNLPDSIRARFIFPHAPVRAVTLNSGIQMPAWYDIYSLDMDSKEDIQGVEKITHEIHTMIDDQIQSRNYSGFKKLCWRVFHKVVHWLYMRVLRFLKNYPD